MGFNKTIRKASKKGGRGDPRQEKDKKVQDIVEKFCNGGDGIIPMDGLSIEDKASIYMEAKYKIDDIFNSGKCPVRVGEQSPLTRRVIHEQKLIKWQFKVIDELNTMEEQQGQGGGRKRKKTNKKRLRKGGGPIVSLTPEEKQKKTMDIVEKFCQGGDGIIPMDDLDKEVVKKIYQNARSLIWQRYISLSGKCPERTPHTSYVTRRNEFIARMESWKNNIEDKYDITLSQVRREGGRRKTKNVRKGGGPIVPLTPMEQQKKVNNLADKFCEGGDGIIPMDDMSEVNKTNIYLQALNQARVRRQEGRCGGHTNFDQAINEWKIRNQRRRMRIDEARELDGGRRRRKKTKKTNKYR